MSWAECMAREAPDLSIAAGANSFSHRMSTLKACAYRNGARIFETQSLSRADVCKHHMGADDCCAYSWNFTALSHGQECGKNCRDAVDTTVRSHDLKCPRVRRSVTTMMYHKILNASSHVLSMRYVFNSTIYARKHRNKGTRTISLIA